MFDYLIPGQALLHFGNKMARFAPSLKRGTLLRRRTVESAIESLEKQAYTVLGELSATAYKTKEPVPFAERFSGEKVPLQIGTGWAEDTFDCCWMHITGRVPQGASDVVFLIDTAGEGLVYDKNGRPVQGITCYASQYDYRLGHPRKRVVLNDGLSDADGTVEFFIDCGANDLFGKYHYKSALQLLSIARENREIRGLMYDLQVLVAVYDCNPKNDYGTEVFRAVTSVAGQVKSNITEEKAAELRATLAPYLAAQNDDPNVFAYSAIGHSHLDLGWLWPLRETQRKGARTFRNQIVNIRRYPDYIFGASQAQLYAWMRDLYPEIYAEVKELHAAGRWELQGATWCEPDSNLISGESLVRQFYYGKRYFQQEFGEEMKILWLPDSFGYSGCIPQVMALADVPYFLTQKMSWNTVNKFPYHTFHWEGIDGTRVFAHMLPEDTYNGTVRGEKLSYGEKNYRERPVSGRAISLFGIGDGGGGPGFEHLERAARLRDLKGLPKYEPETALAGFEHLDDPAVAYPTYRGELYLERHQACSTTQARVKYFNRKCELLLRNYEILAVQAKERGVALPVSTAELDALWQEVLLYQFHDILPGSCIDRVYEENVPRYQAIADTLTDGIAALAGTLYGDGAVVNLNSFAYSGLVAQDGAWKQVTVPAFGALALSAGASVTTFAAQASDNSIENDAVRVTFERGLIVSIFDKRLQKELIKAGESANLFSLYHDHGDAWDIKPVTYYKKHKTNAHCVAFQTGTDGAKAWANVTYQVKDTTIQQTISITDGAPTVTFSTDIDFHAHKQMLRVAFPVSVQTDECKFNVQFGHVARPTTEKDSYDTAQFEVSGQKFVDMSQDDWGVSLLNDCKYGFRCKHGVMDMDVLRAHNGFPSKHCDQGASHLEYALFPHAGALGWETYRAAYELNNPLVFAEGTQAATATEGFAQTDNPNVLVETLKIPAEGEGVIVRVYNSSEEPQTATVTIPGYKPQSVVNILERTLADSDGTLQLHKFELVNLRYTKQ